MKRLMDLLKTARRIETPVILALICMLLLLLLQDTGQKITAVNDEQRLQHILSQIENAGSISVMIAEDENERPMGAVVAAEGAGDMHVMLEIQRAVRALTGLELDQIEIVKSGR